MLQSVARGDAAAWAEECAMVLREDREQAAVLATPDLERWMASELHKESAALWELRRGRDELARLRERPALGGFEQLRRAARNIVQGDREGRRGRA